MHTLPMFQIFFLLTHGTNLSGAAGLVPSRWAPGDTESLRAAFRIKYFMVRPFPTEKRKEIAFSARSRAVLPTGGPALGRWAPA